jgi:cytochrome P450
MALVANSPPTESGSETKAIPRTAARPPLGDLLRFRHEPLRLFFEAWQELGDLVRLRFGALNVLLTIHPDWVQHVLQGNARNYDKGTRGFNKLKLALGEGLLTADGAFWRNQRRIIQPVFHRERLHGFGVRMTEAASSMLERWEEHARKQEPFDVAEEMTALTLNIIGQTMFSADLAGDSKMLSEMVTLASRHINERITSLSGVFDVAEKFPTAKNRRFAESMRAGDALIQRIIARRHQNPHENSPQNSGDQDQGDLLSMLMASRDEETGQGMSDRQLRDEVVTIFSAGHETTALALTWTFYLLSTHPEVERRLRQEVDQALGGHLPTVADLPRLAYVTRVIKEAMRLFPPAWAISRRSIGADRFGPYPIPPKAFVLLCPYLTHRHPAFWDNPEGFDPDRFLPERMTSQHRFAYFPFGAGARMCIGSNFAMMEAQLVLATVVQRFQLSLVPGHPIELEPLITLRSRKGMRMIARHQEGLRLRELRPSTGSPS